MNPLKKHYETLTILGGMGVLLVGCCMWINGRFNEIDKRLTKIETIMILRGIVPPEMMSVKHDEKQEKG